MSPDSVVDDSGVNTQNLFAYCANNPVLREDTGGQFWDTVLDVVSLAFSVADVIQNPKSVWSWIGLAADVVSLVVPGLTGGSSIVKAVSKTDDVVDAVKAVNAVDKVDDAFDTIKAVDKAKDSLKLADGACFVAGTQILTKNGYVSIENISAGDVVYSKLPETGEIALKKVAQTFIRDTYELVHLFIDEDEIVTTPEHPFYVLEKGWVTAINLRAGDILVTVNGKYVIVEKIQHEILENPVKVYNFEVEDFHTYFVGDISILVHNVCTNKAATELAEMLGYSPTNYRSHGKKVYYNPDTKLYITPDVDGHNGGVWKMAKSVKDLNSKAKRLGTYDQFLNWIGP